MSERKIIQVEDKVPFKHALAAQHSAHVCHVRRICACTVHFRDQSGNCVIYERCGNFDFYDSDQGEGAGILRFQLCISCTGRNRY